MRADWEMELEAPPADTHYKTEDAKATKGNELKGYLSKRGLLMRLHGEKGFGRPAGRVANQPFCDSEFLAEGTTDRA